MGMMDEARERLYAAEKALKDSNHRVAMREACYCAELTSKALLDEFSISYQKEGKYYHDVSELLSEVWLRLGPNLDQHERESAQKLLARLAIVHRMLASIHVHTDFGVGGLDLGASDIFDWELQELVKGIVGQVGSIHRDSLRLFRNIQEKKRKAQE